MSKVIALAVLAAFALSLPFVNVSISSTPEKTIATLDVCSPDAPGTTADTTIIAEPAFELQPALYVAYLRAEDPLMQDSKIFSPIDKPPLA